MTFCTFDALSGRMCHIQYEASMTVNIGRTANQRKVTKWLSFQKNVIQYN